jgi:hypothetical protein
MHERGDTTTFHEPFLYLYYVHDAKKELVHFDRDPKHPTSYTDIKTAILDAAENGPVFVKDMCYYVSDYIHHDLEFVKRTKNTFLIRTPEKTIPSYYRLDPQVTLEEIGVEAQYRHFELVRRSTGEWPIVVDAEDLLRDPDTTMRTYCRALGIEFVPESLNWETPVPPHWKHVAGWHEDLSRSRGIARDPTKVDAGKEMASVPHLRQYLTHHLPYFHKLREFRLKPLG